MQCSCGYKSIEYTTDSCFRQLMMMGASVLFLLMGSIAWDWQHSASDAGQVCLMAGQLKTIDKYVFYLNKKQIPYAVFHPHEGGEMLVATFKPLIHFRFACVVQGWDGNIRSIGVTSDK